MTAATKKRDIGKWFEGKFQEKLDELKSRKLCTYVRLYDTRSAGAYIPAQPGDFIVLWGKPRNAVLVECKSSAVHKSLKSCASSHIETNQVTEHRIWHIANHPSLFIFYSEPTGKIEIWDGRHVVAQRLISKPLNPGLGLLSHLPFKDSMKDLHEFFRHMVDLPLTEEKEKTDDFELRSVDT